MTTVKYSFLIFIFFIQCNFSASQTDNPQVDSVINAFMTKWDLPGGSFTMAYDTTVLYSKGYGVTDIVSMEPVTTESLFRIASCTKPFTAVAVMKLIQEGKLSLEDTVFGPNGILDQSQYQTILDSNVLKIKIVNLLEHTAGWDDNYQIDPMFSSTEISEWANTTPPAFQETIIEYVLSQMTLIHTPGTFYAYSNFGFCVLGRVIEKITGMSYENYVRQNVLIPSDAGTMKQGKNLENQRFPDEVHYYGCPGEETGYSVIDTTKIVPFPYGAFNIEAMDSHGDWIASSADLVKFMIAVHKDRLISQHTYNIMVTPPAVNPYYAKGWAVNGQNIFHVGSLPGTVSEIVKAHNQYIWALVFNKRNLNDTIYDDLDDIGWTIQKYLSPPSLSDSCIVAGPASVTTNIISTYHTDIPSQTWEIFSYDGAMANIVSVSGNDIVVNSGPSQGRYTVYKTGGDSGQLVLCSLNVRVDLALPVELISFSSSVSGRNVLLSWTTSSEENNSGFEIQKSESGKENSWLNLGFILGKGSTGIPAEYNFTDRNISSGRYKYRLKQMDFNGNHNYHGLPVEVYIGIPGKYFLSENYPNPFNPVTKINFDIPVSSYVKLKVYDLNGKEIKSLVNEYKAAGYYTVIFDAGLLSSGAYFYRLESNESVLTRKMILIK